LRRIGRDIQFSEALGKSRLGAVSRAFQRGIQCLLYLSVRNSAWLLMPHGDRSRSYTKMRRKGIIAHTKRLLKRASGAAGPLLNWFH
jgi:hypothetical protein